ncbi:MAG: hypothetical protein ABI551_03115, partial [Polyangiaceae bacterium]
TVSLTSGDPSKLTVPASVSVADGTTSVVVPVTALAQASDVTVTASLDSKSSTGHVRVLGAAEGPTTVTLSPANAAVAPNGTTTLTLTMDLPPPADITVGLAVTAGGTVPATVTVPANQSSATFTYTDNASTADVTVTASYLASTSSATVKVSTGVDHLVINEVDYDQKDNPDSVELVEIFNPSVAAKSTVGVTLYLVNGSGNKVYATVDLTSAGSIPAQGYLVIGAAAVTLPSAATNAAKLTPATAVWPATNAIQNGSPDGMALVDTNTTTLLDALSYASAMTAVTLPGFASPVSLVEGTVATATDSNTADGSLCRSPNGQDTDIASADWKFCTTVTTGYANP